MTPNEKAKELLEKFMQPIDELNKYPMCFDTAKQCALIAVNEVLNDDWYITTLEDLAERRKYWRQVKQEINKL